LSAVRWQRLIEDRGREERTELKMQDLVIPCNAKGGQNGLVSEQHEALFFNRRSAPLRPYLLLNNRPS